MPLCVPTDHLYFTFGYRVRHSSGGDRWNSTMHNLTEELTAALERDDVEFLSKIESLSDLVEHAESIVRTERVLEAIGYVLAREGKASQAVEVLDELLNIIDMTIPWHRDLAGQVSRIKRMLTEHPESAQAQLIDWEIESIRNLGLDEFSRA
jgi:hypothetical protein